MTLKMLPVAVLLLVGANTLPAQTLADIARQAQDTREKAHATAAPVKVYTNDTLVMDPRDAVLAAAVPPAALEPPPASATVVVVPGAPALAATDEATWRGRMRALVVKRDADITL